MWHFNCQLSLFHTARYETPKTYGLEGAAIRITPVWLQQRDQPPYQLFRQVGTWRRLGPESGSIGPALRRIEEHIFAMALSYPSMMMTIQRRREILSDRIGESIRPWGDQQNSWPRLEKVTRSASAQLSLSCHAVGRKPTFTFSNSSTTTSPFQKRPKYHVQLHISSNRWCINDLVSRAD